MANVGKGMLAGLSATVVLSALMVMKSSMGIMPELDIIKMLSGMLGAPDMPIVGWVMHFMIGVLAYGTTIAIAGGRHTQPVGRGVVIALVAWLVMMLVLMPVAGAGLFGLRLGTMAPLMTLVLHLIFGIVLGWTYGQLRRQPQHGGLRTAIVQPRRM